MNSLKYIFTGLMLLQLSSGSEPNAEKQSSRIRSGLGEDTAQSDVLPRDMIMYENADATIIQEVPCNTIPKKSRHKLARLSTQIKAAKHSDSLLNCFARLRDLKAEVNKEIELLVEQHDTCFRKYEFQFPFLSFSWVAEGSVPFFTYNNEWFAQQALHTQGAADDSLFALLKDVWGLSGEDGPDTPLWEVGVSCLSNYSTLGDGIYLSILRRINHIKEFNNPVLTAELELLKKRLVDDIPHRWYGNSYETALKELKEIINSGLLREEDKENLINLEKDFKQKEGREFDSINKPCNYE